MKILVQLKDNCMHFKVRKKLTEEYKNMLNTNIISDNEILFSDEYILDNIKIVAPFLNQIAKQSDVDTVCIDVCDITLLILDLVSLMPDINGLIIGYDANLKYNECLKISKCSNIRYFNCYNLQEFMLEILHKKNIIVENRCEILFLSRFMEENNLKSLSSIYYKKTIIMTLPLSKEDEMDFATFASINNNYLRVIHLKNTQLVDIEFIVNVLKKNRLKNIKILIHDDHINDEVLTFLKKFKEKNSRKYKIDIRISYSKKYIENNLLPQTNINILKLCCISTIFIICCVFGYVFYDNYKIAKEVEVVQSNIQTIIKTTDTKSIVDKLNELNKNTQLKVENEEIVSLLPTNDETVGWIKVNKTNIDYAIVQADDNKFYLNHSFDKSYSNAGWVFMDYRNNPKQLDDNTIVYGHNRYSNGTMFGTLGYALNQDWYLNEENQIISFNTIYSTMKWKIFSIYKIPVTVDYLTIDFYTDDERMAFYNMLRDRSIYDFDQELKPSDKILTLSTCSTDGGRIVVHAVLLNEE